MEKESLINRSGRHESSDRFRYNFVKTGFLVTLWVVFGGLKSIVGTTMVDIDEQIHTTFDKLGVALTLFGVACVLGAIVASVFRDKVGVTFELILTMAGVMMSSACVLIPLSKSLVFYSGMVAAAGFSIGCLSTVANTMVVHMWGDKASVPVHALHFAYGLGAFLGPFLAKDFLSVRCPSHAKGTDYFNEIIPEICVNSTDDDPTVITPSRLQIPFCVIATIALLLSCVFFIYYLIEKFSARLGQTPAAILEQENETVQADDEQQPLKFFLPFVIGLFFFYLFLISFEGVLNVFIFTFAYKSGLGFDKPEAAYVQSAYWGSFTASRFVASIIAHFVSVKVMIFVEMIGTVGSLVGLLFLGFKLKTAMWVFFCCLGVFVAPVWPSGIAWVDRYVGVKAYVIAAIDAGAGIGTAVCSFLAGHFVEIGASRSYLYVSISGSAAALMLLVVMQFAGHKHGDRHHKKSPPESISSSQAAG